MCNAEKQFQLNNKKSVLNFNGIAIDSDCRNSDRQHFDHAQFDMNNIELNAFISINYMAIKLW